MKSIQDYSFTTKVIKKMFLVEEIVINIKMKVKLSK